MTEHARQYVLGHSAAELERLHRQGGVYGRFTHSMLVEAGVGAGMRVLDVGSGSGDVSFIAAELVGPSGEVIGVDQSADAVAHANDRAKSSAMENVRFISAKLDENIVVDGSFDAIIGRLVLMYLDKPAEVLASLARHLRPGGIVAFQELDIAAAGALPDTSLLQQARHWVQEGMRRSGAEMRMGPKLHATFLAAGLPAPHLSMDGQISGSDGAVPAMMAQILRTLLPQLEHQGIAAADEVAIDTLEQRVRRDLAETAGTMWGPLLISAWIRLDARP